MKAFNSHILPDSAKVHAAVSDWARTDGQTWIYVFKTVIAALLALGIAMRLQLASPRTAMTTVFIVMQPQSGPVFAKSFYRICGTFVGLLVMLVLIGLFPQQPELFIGCTALWVGICTTGAARNRNFRAYGFVLAGYTAALIGVPASQHPDGAFMSAMSRVADITLGILCSGLLSAVVFPQSSGAQLKLMVRRRYLSFAEYISTSLTGVVADENLEVSYARLVADVIRFEAGRSVAVFETTEAKRRSRRLARFNSELMTASTRIHALSQLAARLRSDGRTCVMEALTPSLQTMCSTFGVISDENWTVSDATAFAIQIEKCKVHIKKHVCVERVRFAAAGPNELLDFDTATELLDRFLGEMIELTHTYASLAMDSHERENWRGDYMPKTNLVAACIAGARATIVTSLLGAYWLETAWPSGVNLVVSGASTCALASASPTPARNASQMALGTILAVAVGMILMFGLYPTIQGFPALCLVLVPPLAFGVFLTTRPALAGYGFGYCIFLCTLAGPDNLVHFDPIGYMNDSLALAISMGVAVASFAVVLPPATPWLRNRSLANLHSQVAQVCRNPRRDYPELRNRFESRTRDLMFQLAGLSGNDRAFRERALHWMLASLEVGGTVLDLRDVLATIDPTVSGAIAPQSKNVAEWAITGVGAFFQNPSPLNHAKALSSTTMAIEFCHKAHNDAVLVQHRDDDSLTIWRILIHLRFIRSALIDKRSPVAAHANGNL